VEKAEFETNTNADQMQVVGFGKAICNKRTTEGKSFLYPEMTEVVRRGSADNDTIRGFAKPET
jgi:hypothetical protein